MSQSYFSLVTTTGKIKLAQSAAGGGSIVISHFAIGDGNGAEVNPTAASTSLVREVWRTQVESVVTDPDNPSAVLVTAIIPTNAGGWWMREFGIFDQAGDMIAVAKPISQYKPTALEGQLEDIRYEFQIIIGENANVTLLVDPSILLASREWVQTRKIPMSQMMRLPWLPVISMTTTAPPVSPAQGDAYLVPDGATGAWAANVGRIAEYLDGAWSYATPVDGHGISLPDGRIFVRIGGTYVAFSSTAAEALAGSSSVKFISPATLAAVFGARFGAGFSRLLVSQNPVFPEVESTSGRMTVTISGLTVAVAVGQTWMHRGLYRYSSTDYPAAQRTFSVAASNEYHLRWTPNNGFELKNLADTAYNPSGLEGSAAAFDTSYDDMLVAVILVDGSSAVTVTPLINKQRLSAMATIAGSSSVISTGGTNDGVRVTSTLTLYWSRTPSYHVSGHSGNTATAYLHGFANRTTIVSASRHGIQAHVDSDFIKTIDGNTYGSIQFTAFA